MGKHFQVAAETMKENKFPQEVTYMKKIKDEILSAAQFLCV
jgi:hypothetical protein